MNVIAQNVCTELDIKHSRFVAETFAVTTQEDARVLLKAQKTRYRDATHVVHAFVIGTTGEILGCSDDGEPSGTAGRPVLDVLKGSGVTNVLLTVARWFGGTLLGTGGLVKAYGESAKAVLALTPVEELVAIKDFTLTVSYDMHDRFRREIETFHIDIVSEEFGTEIIICGRIRASLAGDFCKRIMDLTCGQSTVVLNE